MFTEAHLKIFEICLACPEIEPLSNCTFKKIRSEITEGRTEMIEEISTEQAITLVNFHLKCMQKRIRERLFE